MIETLPGLPDGVIGFRAVGTVTADDYRTVVDPAIKKVVDEGEKLNIVFEMGLTTSTTRSARCGRTPSSTERRRTPGGVSRS